MYLHTRVLSTNSRRKKEAVTGQFSFIGNTSGSGWTKVESYERGIRGAKSTDLAEMETNTLNGGGGVF
jgi:hypothetical protein